MFLALALAVVGPVFEPPAGDPFDLAFVPDDRPARLIGLRPAALVAIPPLADALEARLGEWVAEAVTAAGGDPAAGRLPPLGDIRQVMAEGFQLALPSATARGMLTVHNTWYVVRTADPFDWAGLAAAWFPAGEDVEHAGHRYRRVRLPAALLPPEVAEAGYAHFYQADPRTVVFAFDADRLTGMIDRLKAGGRVTPPPLWEAVERCPLAMAAGLADRSWLTVPDDLPADRPAVAVYAGLLRRTGGLAVGLGLDGDRLRLTAAVTAEDPVGLVGPLQAAAARTGGTPGLRLGSDRVTADVRVPLAEALQALFERGDDD